MSTLLYIPHGEELRIHAAPASGSNVNSPLSVPPSVKTTSLNTQVMGAPVAASAIPAKTQIILHLLIIKLLFLDDSRRDPMDAGRAHLPRVIVEAPF